jgi:hypothetical protein
MSKQRQSKALPCRQLGRVDDAAWDALRDAARADGMSFTAWALAYLLPLAECSPEFRASVLRQLEKEME